MRVSKPSSQSRIAHQATGQAIRLAMITGLENCQASSPTMSRMRAPSTLRMPISLVRRSAVKAARPNRPRQATITASSGEAGEHLGPRRLRLVELDDDVLAELGRRTARRWRSASTPARPRRAPRADRHSRSAPACGVAVGLVDPEHDRIDRLADRAEARILDDADDVDRHRAHIPRPPAPARTVLPTASAGLREAQPARGRAR